MLRTQGPNILAVHIGALGDFICTFPALNGLRKQCRRIDVLCKGELGKLACGIFVADHCFPLESAIFSTLFTDAPDPRAKDLLRSYGTILLFSFSKQLERTMNGITKNVFRIDPRAGKSVRKHTAGHIVSSLFEFGLLDETAVNLSTGLDRRDKNNDRKRIIIHPGSGSGKKNWPVSRFLRTAELLQSDGFDPEFIIGPAEYFMEAELSEFGKAGVAKISDLSDLVSRMRRSGGYIGNDSGVSHLAACVGLPTVAVFGPSDPERWRPVGRAVKAVRPNGLDCAPCFEIDKHGCSDMQCLKMTAPETVAEALRTMI